MELICLVSILLSGEGLICLATRLNGFVLDTESQSSTDLQDKSEKYDIFYFLHYEWRQNYFQIQWHKMCCVLMRPPFVMFFVFTAGYAALQKKCTRGYQLSVELYQTDFL